MLDIKWIRENPEAFNTAMAKRGSDASAEALIALDEARRSHIGKVQDAQQRRNAASKEIGQAMAAGDQAKAEAIKAEVAELKTFLSEAEEEERQLNAQLHEGLSTIPNVPMPDVPQGDDEAGNVLVRTDGEKPIWRHEAKEHFDIGEALGLMDFDAASQLSGSRFTVLKGSLARLERALGQFMLDLHTTEHGYMEVMPPLLVNAAPLFGTGQLPKFEDDQFKTESGHYLIPTAEVPLTNLAREAIHAANDLPMRLTALTPCFRLEAGSAGRDTRGMLRQHQFNKCEMVTITDAEQGEAELERMTACAEKVLQKLGLHYRVMMLCDGDMGFSARKTYDIEVWLPGQGTYREISSCSYCGDFQARRMNARYRQEGDKTPIYAHTLNGSGIAVGRALIAVLENYLNEDGSVTVPDVLKPYMGGITRIEKAS